MLLLIELHFYKPINTGGQDNSFGFKDFTQLIFLDSLNIFKQRLKAKNITTENNKLGTIYNALFQKPIQNQHTATADVMAMLEISGALLSTEKPLHQHMKSFLENIPDLKGSYLAFKDGELLSDKEMAGF